MNEQKLARILKFYPIFFTGLAAGIFTHIALERGSLGMILIFLGWGFWIAHIFWNWHWELHLLSVRETCKDMAKDMVLEAMEEQKGSTPTK